MNFHEPEVDVLTYFLSHPGYWGGMIAVILIGAYFRTMREYRKETNTKPSGWFLALHAILLLFFVASGLTVLYYKVVYLTMFWN